MGGRLCSAAAGLPLADITHTFSPTKAQSIHPSKELQHPRGHAQLWVWECRRLWHPRENISGSEKSHIRSLTITKIFQF